MKLKSLGFAVLSTLTTISAVAADLTLVGDSAANWDTSTPCWTNSTGTSVAFQTDDNVLISSDYFTGPSLTMTARLIPGDVEFDIDRNLDFSYRALANGIGKDAKSFVKRGYFKPEEAKKLYQRHLAGEINISKDIWKWINLELWFKEYID